MSKQASCYILTRYKWPCKCTVLRSILLCWILYYTVLLFSWMITDRSLCLQSRWKKPMDSHTVLNPVNTWHLCLFYLTSTFLIHEWKGHVLSRQNLANAVNVSCYSSQFNVKINYNLPSTRVELIQKSRKNLALIIKDNTAFLGLAIARP